MADKLTFIIILHNHQPVGNFDWVFEQAARDAYMPFLDVLECHPGIKCGLHTTGPLLEWFAAHRPEYLDRVKALVDNRRLELLGGAFYEPIISILPDRDKTGQIEMMNRWIEERFGKSPRGCWLAERIWEPGLASTVGNCGMRYTTLDNSHFQYAGLGEDRIWGSYVTDDNGIPLRVLPIDYRLRYLIPFHEPQETIDYLASMKDRGACAVTYADDGEKFGLWPGTNRWVYGEGWLEKFFTALEDNADWIDIVFPWDYVNSTPPLGRVYLPTTSYREMMEWALPVEAQKKLEIAGKLIEGDGRLCGLVPFIRGGFWRNFLVKYPESDTMYRRMLMVSDKVEEARRKAPYREAVRELYRAQCNCGYWHGVFGGLYLNFLRRAIYEHLIRAERHISPSLATITVSDFNADGYDEIVMENDALTLFVVPHTGGAALELDYHPKAFNLFDTFTRREEVYHSRIDTSTGDHDTEHASIHDSIRVKDKRALESLVYDTYRRLNFIEHFILRGETLDAFAHVRHTELGDFVEAPYDCAEILNKRELGVRLRRDGYIHYSDSALPVRIEKKISIPKKGATLTASYSVHATGLRDVMFGVEMNFGLQSGRSEDSFIEIPGRTLEDTCLASAGEEPDVTEVVMTVGWMPVRIVVRFSRPALLWRLPVETVSLSEGGIEKNYQNTCLVPLWGPGGTEEPFTVDINMGVETW